MRLRSRIDPEEQSNLVVGPTTYRKGPNQFESICEFCGGTFYVDEVTFRQALTAMEEGSENPFCCGECENDFDEVSHLGGGL
jgi:hypothetical protein